jgi:hypothetical protein
MIDRTRRLSVTHQGRLLGLSRVGVLPRDRSVSEHARSCAASTSCISRSRSPASDCPEIVNTDHGAQFTSAEFPNVLRRRQIQISVDGQGCRRDNVFVERLWRSVKYGEVYLHAYQTVADVCAGLTR